MESMNDPAALETRQAAAAPDVIAPDGSEVRLLCGVPRGGMATFTLPPGAVARAVVHRTVEELWYVVAGAGRIWRRLGAREDIVPLSPGVSVNLPVGTVFQFRSDGDTPLVVLGVTMPPWPGEGEAVRAAGTWEPTA